MCEALLNAEKSGGYNVSVHFLWNTELWINTFRFRNLSRANTTKTSMASYARSKQARVVQLQHFIQPVHHYHVTLVGF